MAKTLKKVTKSPGNQVQKSAGTVPANILLHQLILRNIDRSKKNVGDWRIAHRMAEAIMNPTRRRLWDLFEDVKLDATIKGTWRKRVSAVANKKLFATRDGVHDESFDTLTNSISFRRLRKKRMEEISHGVVGFEFIPGTELTWEEINRRHIRTELGLVTIEADGYTGFEYATNKNVIICEGEDPFGFLLYASPYALFKKGNWADWSQYIEIFGQPVIITKYDGFDEKTRQLLEQALENAGSSLRLMLPKQSEFEMLDGKSSNGDGRLQDTFLKALNNELLILILGNTETTTNDNGGSNAKGQVHSKQQLEITKDDMEEELMFFNSPKFAEVLKTYGYNSDGIIWKYEDEVDNDSLKKELEIDQTLDKLGVPLGHDYFYNKYNRPKPANYDAIIAEKKSAPQQIAGDPKPMKDDNIDEDPVDNKKDKEPERGKNETTVMNALKGLTFWQKVKSVFSEAP